MFAIKYNNYYFHKNGKIILFEDFVQAQNLVQAFSQYASARAIQEGYNPFEIAEVFGNLSSFSICEKDFVENPQCGCINFNEIQA